MKLYNVELSQKEILYHRISQMMRNAERIAEKFYGAVNILFFTSCSCYCKDVRSAALFRVLLSLVVVVFFPAAACCFEARVSISSMQSRSFDGWQEKEFAGRTDYAFVEEEQKGWVLKAHSEGTASGLVREQVVDISATPYLHWSWKVELLPEVADEKTKGGDDYGARIYVIFKTGPWFWDTRALNYVWSSNYKVGETWPNAFTSNACMVVVQSGDEELGKWVDEKYNVKEDIAACFGIDVETIRAVALMSDSDNSKSQALAYYSDIYFTAN